MEINIIDVFNDNLHGAFEKIRDLIDEYPYVAMDTEFPGVVVNPRSHQFKSHEDFRFQQMTQNVNLLKLIQVGFTMMNEKGELPPGNPVWQFNFHFSLSNDMFAINSIDLLKTAGINFEHHELEGIRAAEFGELLTTSGLISNADVKWITFHSGYDFGYLMRAITLADIPTDESKFFEFYHALFPTSYDIKMITKMPGVLSTEFHGGLQEIADQLQVKRFGAQHQAGSDSLLTAQTFFKMKELFFDDKWDKVSSKVNGLLYGFESCSLHITYHPMYPTYPRMGTPPIPNLLRADSIESQDN
ncbi:hypothetical protein QR680_018682 [Steinernema hermaphroditum]|uniref:poly(A)-specific ribonuclease n=1 Tax=Steinernema hermaphroditum TaxID=289476 RepID=A0AA39HJL3_9BILA|nr:hypothetical protein QR680_018682 [Steinernema hermaphroditum]